jgi:RNA polymerase sigma-70 factor (ECF subfamily)
MAANAVLRDPVAADDVVQEVFTELWSRPRGFDPRRGSLATYVTMLARCRALDARRARRTLDAALERAAAAEPRGQTADEPADAAVLAETRTRALRAIDRLPPAQRDALLLVFGRGLTIRELAQVTGTPLGTAKSRVRLALSKSRQVA